MKMTHPIHIIGHRNPDTDASTSAVGYARFLNAVERYDVRVKAAVPGQLTPQARWVFDQAEAEPPRSLKPSHRASVMWHAASPSASLRTRG